MAVFDGGVFDGPIVFDTGIVVVVVTPSDTLHWDVQLAAPQKRRLEDDLDLLLLLLG